MTGVPRPLSDPERKALARVTTALAREASELRNALAQLEASGHVEELAGIVGKVRVALAQLEDTRDEVELVLSAGEI